MRIMQSIEEECVKQHNVYRHKHDVPPLKLNKTLSANSQIWADHLIENDIFKKSGNRKYGESIYSKQLTSQDFSFTGREAVDFWYNAIKFDTFGAESKRFDIIHFKHVIYKDYKELGIGYAMYNDKIVLVAHYHPQIQTQINPIMRYFTKNTEVNEEVSPLLAIADYFVAGFLRSCNKCRALQGSPILNTSLHMCRLAETVVKRLASSADISTTNYLKNVLYITTPEANVSHPGADKMVDDFYRSFIDQKPDSIEGIMHEKFKDFVCVNNKFLGVGTATIDDKFHVAAIFSPEDGFDVEALEKYLDCLADKNCASVSARRMLFKKAHDSEESTSASMTYEDLVERYTGQLSTVQDISLDCILKNETQAIKILAARDKTIITNECTGTEGCTSILHRAISDANVKKKTIKTLLDLGADPCQICTHGNEAIHVAAKQTRSDLLELIINHNSDTVNRMSRGDNPLHVLIKYGNHENREEFINCVKILVQAKVDVNKLDYENKSPIFNAAERAYSDVIEELFQSSDTIDIDGTEISGLTARELIMQQKLLPHRKLPNHVLFNYIEKNMQHAFVTYNKGDITKYKNLKNASESHTLLQLGCERGVEKIVGHLVSNEADLQMVTTRTKETPLELAALYDHYRIVELLLEQKRKTSQSFCIPSTIITELLKKIKEGDTETIFYKLLNRTELDLNSGNDDLQTPLHIAVYAAQPDHILALLRRGASLACKDKWNNMPIERIDPEVLCKHLDNCIEFCPRNRNMIIVTYKTILLPQTKGQSYVELENDDADRDLLDRIVETDAITHMCHSNNLKKLVVHPVIANFILYKWNRIRRFVYANIIFSVLFWLSLIFHVLSLYFYNNCFQGVVRVDYYFLLVMWSLLLLRELFQIVLERRKYINDFENYIEAVTIGTVAAILIQWNEAIYILKELCAVSILSTSFSLLLMLGDIPSMSTKIAIFRIVFLNFFIFLGSYSLLIFAFSLNFFLLFSYSDVTLDEDNVQGDSFKTLGLTVFKTLIMLTGEFDAGSLDFSSFPILGRLMFMLFVLIIAVNLLNLLNGLAVSDIQKIENDAECTALLARAKFVFAVEKAIIYKLCIIRRIVRSCTNAKYPICAIFEIKNPDKLHLLSREYEGRARKAIERNRRYTKNMNQMERIKCIELEQVHTHETLWYIKKLLMQMQESDQKRNDVC